jgi:uncharacterized protein (TIGR00255 family)
LTKSMTGWGRSDFTVDEETYSVEVKSLNHRFIDIYLKSPERFSPLENRLRDEVKKRFSRGSISIFVSAVQGAAPALKLNLAMARAYIDAAKELERELGVMGQVDIPLLLKLKDIFSNDKKAAPSESDWGPLREGLLRALDQAEDWRRKEGAALESDLRARIATVEKHVSDIEEKAPKAQEAFRRKLTADMEALLGGKADESRIFLEAALYSERSDISEELTRLKSHFNMFRQYFGVAEPIGKRLDFLCQELVRETNTIASKSIDIGITQTVVEMKGELEKIREQVQNVE